MVKVPIIELHRKGRQVKLSIELCTREVRKVKVAIYSSIFRYKCPVH
jgi:hypothetical protein